MSEWLEVFLARRAPRGFHDSLKRRGDKKKKRGTKMEKKYVSRAGESDGDETCFTKRTDRNTRSTAVCARGPAMSHRFPFFDPSPSQPPPPPHPRPALENTPPSN